MKIRNWTALTLAVLVVSATLACSRSAQSHLERGNAYLEKNNVDAAILEYRNAVEKDPKLAAAYVKLGETFLKKGDGAGAIGAYVRAADLLPNDADVQLKAGSLLLMARKPQEAMARAEKVLAANPKNAVRRPVLRSGCKIRHLLPGDNPRPPQYFYNVTGLVAYYSNRNAMRWSGKSGLHTAFCCRAASRASRFDGDA